MRISCRRWNRGDLKYGWTVYGVLGGCQETNKVDLLKTDFCFCQKKNKNKNKKTTKKVTLTFNSICFTVVYTLANVNNLESVAQLV